MNISDKEITSTHKYLDEFIWYHNLINFDVVFNAEEKDLLSEDCDEMLSNLKKFKNDMLKLKKGVTK